MTEFESWGIPALQRMKTEHPGFYVTRKELAEIIEKEISEYTKSEKRLPKRFIGNLLAGIEERTHALYHKTRPTQDVCPYCLGTGEHIRQSGARLDV